MRLKANFSKEKNTLSSLNFTGDKVNSKKRKRVCLREKERKKERERAIERMAEEKSLISGGRYSKFHAGFLGDPIQV